MDADGAAVLDPTHTQLLFVRQRVLYARGIDIGGASLIGEPMRVAEHLAVYDAYSATAVSRAIYYVALDGMLTRVPFEPANQGPPRVGAAEPKFMTRIGAALQGVFRAQYAISLDGRRFLMNTLVDESNVPPLTVVLNREGRLPR